MSSRHTRRKAAKAKATAKLEALAMAEKSRRIAKVVKANLRSPISHLISEEYQIEGTRNYYPPSLMGSLSEKAATGKVVGHGSAVKYKDRTRFGRWKG
jgi:hypothetical protein